MHSKPFWPFYAVVATIILAALLFLVFQMLWNAEYLVRLGLESKVYYLALGLLGLLAAVVLFGILHSYATYSGKILNGTLKLGGPVVIFLLVPILGFKLVPNPVSFSVAIFVHQADAPAQPFLKGKVLLHLGGDPRTAVVSDKGEAYFIGIPPAFRDQRVAVQLLDAVGYETAQNELKLSGDEVQLAVRAKPVVFRGYVKTKDGYPIPDALVSLAGNHVHTGVGGYFELPIPGMKPESDEVLQVTASGYAPWASHVVPGGNEITAQMDKAE